MAQLGRVSLISCLLSCLLDDVVAIRASSQNEHVTNAEKRSKGEAKEMCKYLDGTVLDEKVPNEKIYKHEWLRFRLHCSKAVLGMMGNYKISYEVKPVEAEYEGAIT